MSVPEEPSQPPNNGGCDYQKFVLCLKSGLPDSKFRRLPRMILHCRFPNSRLPVKRRTERLPKIRFLPQWGLLQFIRPCTKQRRKDYFFIEKTCFYISVGVDAHIDPQPTSTTVGTTENSFSASMEFTPIYPSLHQTTAQGLFAFIGFSTRLPCVKGAVTK